MPSDVNAKISKVTEIFNRLSTDSPPMVSDASELFKLAKELRDTFDQAEQASQQLKDIFNNIKDRAKDTFKENFKEDKPDLLTGVRLKPDLKDPLNRISDKLNLVGNQLSKLSPLGVSATEILTTPSAAPQTTDKSPISAKTTDTSESEDEGAVQMQQFFTNVTRSLIGAQTELNRQSLDYAARLDRRIPPAYYSIPSLKAEMKVGFSETKGKGMNLILFSSKEQRENHGESTLSFELVSVPPPPGSDRPEPPPGFLLVGDEKESLLNKIQEGAGDLGVALTKNFGNTRALAAVLRYAGQDGETKYLVFWPAQTENDQKNKPDFWRNLLVLHLAESKGQLRADPSVFDDKFLAALNKDKQYLLVPDTAGLNKLTQEELVAFINCFGDAILKSLKIFDEYYKTKA